MPFKSRVHSVESYLATLVPEGECLKGPTVRCAEKDGSIKILPAQTSFFKSTLGETQWHRIAYKMANPDLDLRYKTLSQKCNNAWCCRAEHLYVGYDNGPSARAPSKM